LFWFQRGLAVVTALQRLQNHARLVSEPDLSLTDRPRSSQGRFKKIYYFQWFDVFGRACHSKVQPRAQFVSKPRDGRRAVDVGGKQTRVCAASHLQHFRIVVIRAGRCAYSEQMVQRGAELPFGRIWSCPTVH